jgi:ABC-type Zn2+ transport system substrate-binding protein/surface adhesin
MIMMMMMMMMGDDYDNDDDDAADDDNDDDDHHHHHDLTHDINSEQGTETRVVLSPCSLSCRSKKHICVDNVPICTIKC